MEEEKYYLEGEVVAGSVTTNITTIKEQVEELIKPYVNYKVEDETMVGEAKKVRANLNKVNKIIDDEKKRIKKIYLAPYTEMEKVVNETKKLVKDASDDIDKQVKKYEELWKQDRETELFEHFATIDMTYPVDLDQLLVKEMFHKGTTTKKAIEMLETKVYKIEHDIAKLKEEDVEFVDELVIEYLNNDFDKEKAIDRYYAKQDMKEMVSEKKDTVSYIVEVSCQAEADVFEAICDEYEFNYKRRG